MPWALCGAGVVQTVGQIGQRRVYPFLLYTEAFFEILSSFLLVKLNQRDICFTK
jgi:hypothetical protein